MGDWLNVSQALQNALAAILSAGILFLGAVAVSYISKARVKMLEQTKHISDSRTREFVENALNRISSLAVTVVDSIQQESVKSIKEGIKNGVNTVDDLKKLRDVAVQRILGQVTPEVKEAALSQINDLQKYVEDLVSQQVLALRLREKEAEGSEAKVVINNETKAKAKVLTEGQDKK